MLVIITARKWVGEHLGWLSVDLNNNNRASTNCTTPIGSGMEGPWPGFFSDAQSGDHEAVGVGVSKESISQL